MAMRDQQLLDLKMDNFNKATQNSSIAPSYAQKYQLGLSDELMKENRDWLKKDAALKWEIAQIEQMGPNFREILQAQMGGAEGAAAGLGGGEAGGGGGGGLPGLPPAGGGGEEEIPEFGGTAPVSGETPPGQGPPVTNAGTAQGGNEAAPA